MGSGRSRKADGLSYLLVEIDTMGHGNADIEEALGPKNSQPSGWSIRQLRHLVGCLPCRRRDPAHPGSIALTGEDGRTWRPDKAPQAVKDAIEARRKAEAEKRRTYEIPYGQVMFRQRDRESPSASSGTSPPRMLGPDGSSGTTRMLAWRLRTWPGRSSATDPSYPLMTPTT